MNQQQSRQDGQSHPTSTDREEVARRLATAAAGEGRLSSVELGERLPRAHQARTYDELEQLLADLPGSQEPVERTVPEHTVPETLHITASLRNTRRDGNWKVPRHITASAGRGAVVLDFTEADMPHDQVRVDARPNAGNVELVVPEDWKVTTEESVPGSEPVRDKTGRADKSEAGTNHRGVHVLANPGMGSIIVRHAKSGLLP